MPMRRHSATAGRSSEWRPDTAPASWASWSYSGRTDRTSTAPAWALAQQLFGHHRPIFAPVAGLIAVSTTLGQRRRYAVEMVVGITLAAVIVLALVATVDSVPFIYQGF